LTTLLIDLATIGIIAFCIWRGYRNGLIRGAFGIVALVASLFIANITATAYSDEFTVVMKPFVSGIVESALSEIHDDDVEYEFVEHEDESEEFNEAFNALRYIGLPQTAAVRVAEHSTEEQTEAFLSEVVANKLSSTLAHVAVFGIAFALLAIIFTVVGNLIGFVFSLPGLKLLDIIAGIAFGIVKGFIIVYAIATVVRYFGLLAVSTLEETAILNYFVNNNPIAEMLGI